MDATTVALIAAIAGPLGAYLLAARRFSGKIQTTEASDLWAESRSIRDWSQQRIAALEKRVGALETSNEELLDKNRGLMEKNRDCLETTSDLHKKVLGLTEQLKDAHVRIAELEANSHD